MKLKRTMLSLALLLVISGCGGKMKTKTDIRNEVPSKITEDETKPENNPYGFTNNGTSNKNEGSVSYNMTAGTTDTISVYLADDNDSKYNPMSSSGTTMDNNGIRKFIKTANLKFRVNSVIRATYDIEDITHRFGGFVAHTSLESIIDNTSSVAISPDSLLESTYYTVVNRMTLRVPEAKMDSTLRAMTPLVAYMDHRTIDVNDVHIQLMANQLAQARLKNYQNRMKNNVDVKGRNLADINTSEENILQRQEQADNTLINNLTIQDQIEFSTITLYIYQRQAIKREVVFNSNDIEAYEPGFGYQLKHSFKSGWRGLQAVILFLARLWVLFVIAAVVMIGIRIYRKRFM